MGAWSIIQDILNDIVGGFVQMGIDVAEVIYEIASVIDTVFGSNLAEGVQNTINKFNGFKAKVETVFDSDKTNQAIAPIAAPTTAPTKPFK